jgi:hypothetical protein
MRAAELNVDAEIKSVKSKNNAMKGTMIILGHIPGGITGSGHRKWDTSPGGVKAYSLDMKRVRWPVNFKPSGLEKYDGSTNPVEWLEVYQLTSRLPEGTHTSWKITCWSIYHHLPGPGSSGYPRGRFDFGTTCVDCSPTTSTPPMHDWESTGSLPALFRRKESPSGNTTSAFATRGMSFQRLTTSRS